MKYFVVDAFTDEVFKGNPAGVCILDEWLEDQIMQKIAQENNLSDTAFVVKREHHYDLRWFTPKAEMDLCGHATLATSYVISNFIDKKIKTIKFHTLSGILEVTKQEDLYTMDFPSRKPDKTFEPENIKNIIGVKPVEVFLSRDLFLLLKSEQQVKDLNPNLIEMIKLKEGLGVIVTAKGNDVDFVSRCFFPKIGIDEDPVTGSAHCNLIPFWAERLNKNKMTAMQLSNRGGTLYCEDLGQRVKISGKAAVYMTGEIYI